MNIADVIFCFFFVNLQFMISIYLIGAVILAYLFGSIPTAVLIKLSVIFLV